MPGQVENDTMLYTEKDEAGRRSGAFLTDGEEGGQADDPYCQEPQVHYSLAESSR